VESKPTEQCSGEISPSSIERPFEGSRPIESGVSPIGKTESLQGPLMAVSLGFTDSPI